MRLGELCSSIPLRIPHPKIDKLACQAQGVGIFAVGEISLHDAYCEHFLEIFYLRISNKKIKRISHSQRELLYHSFFILSSQL